MGTENVSKDEAAELLPRPLSLYAISFRVREAFFAIFPVG
jgi:hypothetical protein